MTGQACTFPFTLGGVEYTECTFEGSDVEDCDNDGATNDGAPFCATERRGDLQQGGSGSAAQSSSIRRERVSDDGLPMQECAPCGPAHLSQPQIVSLGCTATGGTCAEPCTQINTDPSEPYEVQRGDRIAQLVIQSVEEVIWEEAEQLDETERGQGGFGHSGR